MFNDDKDDAEIWSLSNTWWRRICGVEYDIDRHQREEEQNEIWNECVSPAICTFLGLSSGCFHHILQPNQIEDLKQANLRKIPTEFHDSFLEFLYGSCHSGHDFQVDQEDKNKEHWNWWDIFSWLVELTPSAVHPVSPNNSFWDEFRSAIHFRRNLNSLPNVTKIGELAEHLPGARVVIGNDSRLIDMRLRHRRYEEGRYATFLFDRSIYYGNGCWQGFPTSEDIYRIGMLLRIQRDLRITIPRPEPRTLQITDPKSEGEARLLLDLYDCSPLCCRYLRLPNVSRLRGLYIT